MIVSKYGDLPMGGKSPHFSTIFNPDPTYPPQATHKAIILATIY